MPPLMFERGRALLAPFLTVLKLVKVETGPVPRRG
jgi:hypothetical protein